ncbi:L,D-transpeptidase family protein [Altererythrobacter sp. KTW20L]|uniref:L,D-transpeptidase family protein n=1 Tax=Altererythrobacter sp. KTW20L TaxID=2942210 RepID=UPI0020C12A43|nr:L,D-transpeptidase family protein [Altererythrobacter sp. KTW20L]MCL6251597.1 L,D-transpeptidase family protein [Altererythrobacter sp. KTW20L]
MRTSLLCASAALSLILGACTMESGDEEQDAQPAAATVADSNGADSMASIDPAPGATASADPGQADAEQRPMMQAQVVLERLGFGPGVIDGEAGKSTANALSGFQESRGLPVTGEFDEATRQALAQWDNIAATRIVTIPDDWSEVSFTPVPDGAEAQAGMARLGYENMAEKLAERFHTTPEVLARLNPGGQPARAGNASSSTSSSSTSRTQPTYSPGQQVRVPNVGADRIDAASVDNKDWLDTLRSLGVGTDQPEVTRIVVDESEGWLKAYDEADKLVAMFTVTTGSSNDPLPLGEWGINGVAYNPPFAYDPELFWDVPDSEESQQLPPGPNGPVGVVWIDLTKEHYGIHGTPAPETIGSAQSHGCVRLTNWDAARLAMMVSGSTKVLFQA